MESYCYVYAIIRREASIPPELTGISHAPLSTVAWQELAAVVSLIDSATLPTIPAYVLRHEAVVEALGQTGPTLPARFGTILADPAAVARAVAERCETLRADLARVGDKVELGLTILWKTPAVQDEAKAGQQVSASAEASASSTSGSGTRYLEARLAYYRREMAQQNQARSVIAALEQALGIYTLEQRYRVLSAPRLAVRAAYLIQPQQINDFQRAVDEMRQRQPELRWLLSGPWPPYTFVTRAGKRSLQGSGLKLDRVEQREE